MFLIGSLSLRTRMLLASRYAVAGSDTDLADTDAVIDEALKGFAKVLGAV